MSAQAWSDTHSGRPPALMSTRQWSAIAEADATYATTPFTVPAMACRRVIDCIFLPLKTLHVINYDERNMNLCSHTSLKGFRSVALEMPKRHTQAQTDSQTGACKRTTPLPT